MEDDNMTTWAKEAIAIAKQCNHDDDCDWHAVPDDIAKGVEDQMCNCMRSELIAKIKELL